MGFVLNLSFILADDPSCPLFNSPGYLGTVGAAFDNWAAPMNSTEMEPSLSISAQVTRYIVIIISK